MKALNKHSISFVKGIIVSPDDYADNRIDVATANAELMKFGYMLSEEAFAQLAKADTLFIHTWTQAVSQYLCDIMGHGVWKPLHAGYPTSVMKMSMLERYLTAFNHYWSDGTWFPDQELKEEGYEYENVEYKIINTGTEEDFMNIFTSLVKVNAGIAPIDLRTIEWFVNNYKTEILKKHMPSVIPFKENLVLLAAKGLPLLLKIPTDVLRIAHYFSHGNTDLTLPRKYIKKGGWRKGSIPNPERKKKRFKLSRPQRRYVLSLLEECPYVLDLLKHREQWLRLAEVLHSGSYAKDYPKAVQAIHTLRNTRLHSWKSYVNKAFKKGFKNGVTKLAERPGEFARLLDSCIRKSHSMTTFVLRKFRETSIKVSSKVLWELWTHFKKRDKQRSRYVWIKGARKPTLLKTLPVLSKDTIDAVTETIWNIFYDKFAELEPLGSVWLDEELKKIPLPTNMKTLSEGLITVVRGQRIPIKADKKVLRCYCHWKTGQDLDLSVEFCTADGVLTGVCAFHNLTSEGIFSSGDVIPNIRGNWAEYIDIELDKCPYDYALMTINNFDGLSLNTSKARMGFMERDSVEISKTWSPRTVTNTIEITSTSVKASIVLIDLKTKEWMLVDEDELGIPVSRGNKIVEIMNRLAELPTLSAYDILKLHAEARGKIVAEPQDADTLFKYEDFGTSYEKLLEFML